MTKLEKNKILKFIKQQINVYYKNNNILPASILTALNSYNFSNPITHQFQVQHNGITFTAKPSLLSNALTFDTEFTLNSEFIRVTYLSQKINSTNRLRCIYTAISNNYQQITNVL